MPPPSKTDHLPSSHPAQRQRPKSPNRVLAEAEAQWLFTEAELSNTPSIQDGMSVAEERETRQKGVNFIVQVGIMLKLPQLTLSTAAIFFQRFLLRASLKKARGDIPKLHHYQVAATALFLATKVEESCRKMKEMVLAFCRVAQKNPNLIIDEQIESPHRQLFDMLKYYNLEHNRRLRNASWAFVTDSANTPLCLLCSSRTIAVAGVYAACRFCEVALPDDAKGRPWWEAQHVKLKEVRKATEYMVANYEGGTGKTNGVNGTSAEGEMSIYVGLSTPTDGSLDASWDSTRLRPDSQGASPFLPPPESERRASNASSVGVKREREDEKPTTNGGALNGVRAEDKENKRPRLDERRPTDESRDTDADHDLKLTEEKMRVQNGDKQTAEDVKAQAPAQPPQTNGTAAPPESAKHEDGEVEEGEVPSQPPAQAQQAAKIAAGDTAPAVPTAPAAPEAEEGEVSEEGEVEE